MSRPRAMPEKPMPPSNREVLSYRAPRGLKLIAVGVGVLLLVVVALGIMTRAHFLLGDVKTGVGMWSTTRTNSGRSTGSLWSTGAVLSTTALGLHWPT